MMILDCSEPVCPDACTHVHALALANSCMHECDKCERTRTYQASRRMFRTRGPASARQRSKSLAQVCWSRWSRCQTNWRDAVAVAGPSRPTEAAAAGPSRPVEAAAGPSQSREAAVHPLRSREAGAAGPSRPVEAAVRPSQSWEAAAAGPSRPVAAAAGPSQSWEAAVRPSQSWEAAVVHPMAAMKRAAFPSRSTPEEGAVVRPSRSWVAVPTEG